MAQIVLKRALNPLVTLMEVSAPRIAQRAQPGQFIMLRTHEQGERIPLTISDFNRETGTVTIIYQKVGGTTQYLDTLSQGDDILDFAGPLGHPTKVGDAKRICVVGGGVGCAIAYPQAKFLHGEGFHVDVIAGFRDKSMVILEEEFSANCHALHVTTDDGSHGEKGFVTNKLRTLIETGNQYDLVIAIGPIPMMKFVCAVTKEYEIPTLVSLNPIMIDGTGMCGGCRVTVGGETKFACVDGPDFDGHLVDFDQLALRNRTFQTAEKNHTCRLTGAKED